MKMLCYLSTDVARQWPELMQRENDLAAGTSWQSDWLGGVEGSTMVAVRDYTLKDNELFEAAKEIK